MDWADKKANEIVKAFGVFGSKQKLIAQALRDAKAQGWRECQEAGDGFREQPK